IWRDVVTVDVIRPRTSYFLSTESAREHPSKDDLHERWSGPICGPNFRVLDSAQPWTGASSEAARHPRGKARTMVPFFIPASTLRDSLVLAFLPHKILVSGGVPKGGNDERPKNRGAPRMVCATSAIRRVGAGGDR